jgi:hypothetical protein
MEWGDDAGGMKPEVSRATSPVNTGRFLQALSRPEVERELLIALLLLLAE